MPVLRVETELPASQEDAFAWHARPGALPRLLPPFEPVRVQQSAGTIEDGARVVLRIEPTPLPLGLTWVAEHDSYDPPHLFRDRQVSGPFKRWEHTHRFEPRDPAADGSPRCQLIDSIEYEPPLGALGAMADRVLIEEKLAAMFRYRHRVTREDLTFHADLAATLAGQRKTVLVTGASGLVGRSVCAILSTGGHTVRKLTRSEPDEPGEFQWKPSKGAIDPAALEGVDAVVHLAGESIVGRWNEEKKRRILRSRVDSTRLLAETVGALPNRPALIVASAIGWYGSRGDAVQTEDSPAAETFLADVCEQWEAAAQPAREAGCRTAHLRLGIVLSPEGGALANMLPAFKFGGGGAVGDGSQWWSWIARDDAASLFVAAALDDRYAGVFNAVAPNPVTSRTFAEVLGDVLNRPTFLRVPKVAARVAFGEMADALLLASARVAPERTLAAGYRFRCVELADALAHLLGREQPPATSPNAAAQTAATASETATR